VFRSDVVGSLLRPGFSKKGALSPPCGFASTIEGNLLSATDQEAKLRLVAETAREVWS
jgi:hypothetical protein